MPAESLGTCRGRCGDLKRWGEKEGIEYQSQSLRGPPKIKKKKISFLFIIGIFTNKEKVKYTKSKLLDSFI